MSNFFCYVKHLHFQSCIFKTKKVKRILLKEIKRIVSICLSSIYYLLFLSLAINILFKLYGLSLSFHWFIITHTFLCPGNYSIVTLNFSHSFHACIIIHCVILYSLFNHSLLVFELFAVLCHYKWCFSD